MTIDKARRISDLLKVLDDARVWRETFAGEGDGWVIVSDFESAKSLEASERDGWEGELRLPRDLALELMSWLESRVLQQLRELGVE